MPRCQRHTGPLSWAWRSFEEAGPAASLTFGSAPLASTSPVGGQPLGCLGRLRSLSTSVGGLTVVGDATALVSPGYRLSLSPPPSNRIFAYHPREFGIARRASRGSASRSRLRSAAAQRQRHRRRWWRLKILAGSSAHKIAGVREGADRGTHLPILSDQRFLQADLTPNSAVP